MVFIVDKYTVAIEHIDFSIRLLLDYKAYTAAITLAAVAEEIIGKEIGERSSHSSLKKPVIKEFSTTEKLLTEKDASNILNNAKNLFKHWDSSNPKTAIMDLETETVTYILRAISNFVNLDSTIPHEGSRFFQWLKANRSDIWEKEFEIFLR